jgi:Saccharopine dehydrogenase NADP binding domain
MTAGPRRPRRRCSGPTVLVLGGTGFYGGYLVDELLAFTPAHVVVASRSRPRRQRSDPRIVSVRCDIADESRLTELVRAADIVAHCAGPFVDLPVQPLDVAISVGRPYVDIAEDRAFAAAAAARDGAAILAGVPIMSGMSVSPAMEAISTEYLGAGLERRTALTTYAAPDTRRHRGLAMFETMLSGAGRAFDRPGPRGHQDGHGWSAGQWFDFPPPVGRRLTYIIHDMADVDLLPANHGVGDVMFRAGCEFEWLNRAVALAAWTRVHAGAPDWRWIARPVRALSRVVGQFGRDEGSVAFELAGTAGGLPVRRSIAISARHDGGRIPILPAALAIEALIAGRVKDGRSMLSGWIDPGRFFELVSRRGFQLWERGPSGDGWLPW